MKHLLLATAFALFTTSTAFAETVQDHYKSVTHQIPHVENKCKIVEVPIYGKSEMSTEGAIVGGLIGGIVGNQIGKGSGKEAATGVGALTGAIIGGQGKEKIVGYRQEEVCTKVTIYETIDKRVYSHSTVTFVHDGKKYTLNFTK